MQILGIMSTYISLPEDHVGDGRAVPSPGPPPILTIPAQ
jgi:hypothetical protein